MQSDMVIKSSDPSMNCRSTVPQCADSASAKKECMPLLSLVTLNPSYQRQKLIAHRDTHMYSQKMIVTECDKKDNQDNGPDMS